MLVSAISANSVKAVNINSKRSENIGDTAFNSLNTYSNAKRSYITDNSKQVFDSINQWKHFCEKKVIGKKLNVLA